MAYRGVNLGNWLVLERWMKPALFEPTEAKDEYSLCTALGRDAAEKRLREHRETFITREDFAWLKSHGFDAIRLPIGYWLLEPDGPFVGGIEYLDRAMDWCDEFGIAMNIDLHGLPGNQGPEHHSGREKFYRWPFDAEYLPRSLDFVEAIAQRYRDRRCVKMYSVVNEPEMTLDAGFLQKFYDLSTERIRRHMPADRVAVVIAAFTDRRLPEFHRKTVGQNILTDIHPYYCFGPPEPADLPRVAIHSADWALARLKEFGPQDLIVGEWSLGLSPANGEALKALPTAKQDQIMRAFAANQVLAYDNTAGWFFWSYKVQSDRELTSLCWGARNAVERGWLSVG